MPGPRRDSDARRCTGPAPFLFFTRHRNRAIALIMTDRPTIFALSSGRPPAALAVVRVSGPQASGALTGFGSKMPEPRRASLRKLRHPVSRDVLDEALIIWFPGPNTET